MQVDEEAVGGGRVGVAESESEEDGRCEKAEGVVEVKEFKAPACIDLLRIGPTTPAEHAEHHQEQRHRIRMRCKQFASGLVALL